MSNERTPLLTVVTVAPPRPRPHYNSRLRQCCSFILGTILAFSVTAIVLVLIFVPDCENTHRNSGNHGNHGNYRDHKKLCIPNNRNQFRPSYKTDFGYNDLINILQNTPNEEKIKSWSAYYTSGPHLAGKNLSQAEWTRDLWEEFGISSEIVSYHTYINYPVSNSLSLLSGSKTIYRPSLEEPILEEDETSGLKDRVPAFHGYSASGNVTGQYVYVNYGTYHDFETLIAANVSLVGKIALARYGQIFRGLKVKRAQELGMIGAVLFTDPAEDHGITESNGYKAYPDGPARHPLSIQRGSVQYISIAPGDPTTIGYPSKPGVPRLSPSDVIPGIPSIPISFQEVIPILKALNGHGIKAETFGGSWNDDGLGYKGVEYYVGPSPKNMTLHLCNEQKYVTTPLWNVIGVINGTLSDEVVVVGNHRDAWIAGGAGDPNSGSAALNELIRGFGIALSQGWKPLRTIVFASWDGEEYGLIGSTEWVEEYLPWLNDTAVAYINVDVGTSGTSLKASASPILNKVLIDATQQVLSANQSIKGQTIYDLWNKRINTIGSGSDFTAFQDFAGVPCVDVGFGSGPGDAIYQYHSNFDSQYWMDKFGDVGWHYHTSMARLLGVLTAMISEAAILPFNATDYADALKKYLSDVNSTAASIIVNNAVDKNTKDIVMSNVSGDPGTFGPLDRISAAIERLRNATVDFDSKAAALAAKLGRDKIPWWKWWERIKVGVQVHKINLGYKLFERNLLYSKGLDGRSWFKHVVFAPGMWTGYSGATFPGLVESIESGDKGGLWKWSSIISGLIEKARASIV